MKSKINLFVDAHVFDGIHQGTVTYIAGLYREIVKREDVRLFVGSENYELVRNHLHSDNFIHVKYSSHSKFKRLAIDIPIALKRNKIDYAHFQYIVPIFKTTRYIVTIHDLLFLEYPHNFPILYRLRNGLLFYLSARKADILATVSDYSKKSIENHYKLRSDKIIVTPNAVNTKCDFVEQIDSLVNEKFILFVSRVEPRKNQAKLLQAWLELKLYEKDISIVLVGSMGLNDPLFEKLVADLTTEQRGNFIWLQGVPNEKLIWLYRHCILFVYPSQAEGFGIPPIEAAYHGAKVVCSNLTAMADFDFFASLSFSPNDIEMMKKRILEGISSNINVEEIKEKIEKKYSWPIIADNFIDKIRSEYKSENG